MPLKFPNIEPWLEYKRRLVLDDWDDVNLVTGREGKGKSKWARKVARKLDPGFGVHRIHFDYTSYKSQLPELKRGDCIVLDESRLHARESMTKDRMEILDDFKENRGLGLHHFLVFNRFTKVDKDLVTDRVADWSYLRKRGIVEVRQPYTELWFDKFGVPHEDTQYPLVGQWRFTDWEPAEMRAAYRAKKEDRMRDRQATSRTERSEPAAALVNESQLEDILQRIKPAASVPPRDPAAAARISLAMVDLVQAELGRP